MKRMLNLSREWKEFRRFQQTSSSHRQIVFYSEGPANWTHLGGVVNHLTQKMNRVVCYVSSNKNDPGLNQNNDNILPFVIGNKEIRTVFFHNLDCNVMVMTMPDLHSLFIKRSRRPVHYLYIFHSLVSTHMVYRQSAFDHYDSILTVGPHQVREIRRREEHGGIRRKDLIEHGYGRLDAILKNTGQGRKINFENDSTLCVLVAPSWGKNCLIESGVARDLISTLLAAGIQVILRPHPETQRRSPRLIKRLRSQYEGASGFSYDDDVESDWTLHKAQLMISDWSGAAFDYAFGVERPIIFIDVPRKINNDDWTRYSLEPFEAFIRTEVGEILDPADLKELPNLVRRLVSNLDVFTRRIRAARLRWIFNVGDSSRIGAEAIAEKVDRVLV